MPAGMGTSTGGREGTAAALTDVASALQAVLQLLRLVLIAGNRRRRD